MNWIEQILNWFKLKNTQNHPIIQSQQNNNDVDDDENMDDFFNENKKKIEPPPSSFEKEPKKKMKKIQLEDIMQYKIERTELNKNEIMNMINFNIEILEELGKQLSDSPYLQEYNKVMDMLNQSNTCKKVMLSLSNSQIFYQNTINIIQQHTIIIGKLVKQFHQLNK